MLGPALAPTFPPLGFCWLLGIRIAPATRQSAL